MYVFREGRRSVPGEVLRRPLLRALQELERRGSVSEASAASTLLEALLRAGELEGALADSCCEGQRSISEITNGLATWLVGGQRSSIASFDDQLERLPIPAQVSISAPEGFAYYGLHPLQYASSVEGLFADSDREAVIGIRSIGTTLSAVVCATLNQRGVSAERITVRPEGHPFDRATRFSEAQRSWIKRNLANAAEFVVVDEGPGLSGSSFLSVGEALAAAGVPEGRIIFLCAHQPDPARLCARDAVARAAHFRWHAVAAQPHLPANVGEFVGAGRWREYLINGASGWPASWTSMERPKFLSSCGAHFYKFEGLGHYGAAVQGRAQVLAEAGVGPRLQAADSSGYVRYARLQGPSLTGGVLSAGLLDEVARYCALRTRVFAVDDSGQAEESSEDLALMLRTNLAEEFGPEADFRELPEVSRPVISDGRMQPWEWIVGEGGGLVKCDGVSHGDDHFFPGPTDIAWDLAGTVVEFSREAGEENKIALALLERYRLHSGDDASGRLPGYMLAYSAFRMGYCKMAAGAMQGSEESSRLTRDYLRYRRFAKRLLVQRAAAS